MLGKLKSKVAAWRALLRRLPARLGRDRLRRDRLNRRPGIAVARDAFIAPTAALQVQTHGVWQGGEIRVARGAILAEGVIVAAYGGTIDIGENVFVGPYSVLYGHGGLRIGDNCLIAAHTVIVPSNHTFADVSVPIREQSQSSLGITIEEDVWIGCGARILDGVTIGRGCVVGAGAVVNASLEAHSVAVGVPARAVRKR